jgi:hypothetical protein
MSQVFISWGLPDEPLVRDLCARLWQIGLELFEYSASMDAGDQIPQRVRHEIQRASVAIVCLSDRTARREWILTEVAWMIDARAHGTLKAILPVTFGPLDEEHFPQLLREVAAYEYELSSEGVASEAVERLFRAVCKHLGLQGLITLPAALFAMDTRQFMEVAPVLAEKHWALCRVLAPRHFFQLDREPPDVFQASLGSRYGKTPEDFSPFIAAERFVDVVSASVHQLNIRRSAEKQPPIFIRWLTHELSVRDAVRSRVARDLWRSSNSLVVVDSLSTEHAEIRDRLLNLPDTDPDRMAVMWVPPYTQWTGELERNTDQPTQVVARLNDFFRDWQKRDWGPARARWRSFDIGTSASLWQWVYRMCDELAQERPLVSKLEAVKSKYGVPTFRPQDAME